MNGQGLRTGRVQRLKEQSLPEAIDRREFLRRAGGTLLTVSVGGGLLAACGGAEEKPTGTPAPFEGEELNVAAWSGPYARGFREFFVPSFEQATGARVTILDEWAEIVDKIIAAPKDDPPFDLAIGEGYTQIYGLQNKAWITVDYDNVPNSKDIYPWFFEADQIDAEDDAYGVPFGYAYEVIGWNKEKIPGFQPTSWADLWRPEVQGHLGMDGGFFNYALAAAAFKLGYDPATLEADTPELDQVLAESAKLDVALWYSSGAQSVAALQAGDIDVAQMYIEDIGNLATQDPTFDWVFPQEGAMGWIDYYMPVRGSQVKELAEAFANHLLDPGAQTEFAAHHYYWMSNQKYEIPGDKAQYFPRTDEELRQKSHMFDYDFWLPHFFDETGVYTRFSKEVLKR